jgi:hypothetical protein
MDALSPWPFLHSCLRSSAALASGIALVVGLALLAPAPRSAEAGLSWCGADPVIIINGRVLDVQAFVPTDQLSNVDGPVVYTVHVPKNARVTANVRVDLLFAQKVRFVKDQPAWDGRRTLAVPIEVEVHAKQGSFDVKVQTLNLSLKPVRYMGTTDEPLRFKAAMPGVLGGLLGLTGEVLGTLPD